VNALLDVVRTGCVVAPADAQDRDAAKLVLERIRHHCSGLKKSWANGGSAGPLVAWITGLCPRRRITRESVTRWDDAAGFEVLPHRWIVERTFGWLGRSRRLSKDYEGTIASSEAMTKLAMIHLMTRRLVKKLGF
jgi:putative transposase